MNCNLCTSVGYIRNDLKAYIPVCDLHYEVLKTAENKSNEYFRVRNSVKENQKINKISSIHKRKTRAITNKLIKANLIKRVPCIECGIEDSQCHHFDYTNPSDVIFLCKKHHIEKHLS